MLQELTNKIKKIIPEINELKFGCKVYTNEFGYSIIGCDYNLNGNYLSTMRFCEHCPEIITGQIREIIGRPITLEDVLRCLDINSTDKNWYLGASSNMFGIEYIDEENIKNSKCAMWQLGKPLHEQSKETIKELNKLI